MDAELDPVQHLLCTPSTILPTRRIRSHRIEKVQHQDLTEHSPLLLSTFRSSHRCRSSILTLCSWQAFQGSVFEWTLSNQSPLKIFRTYGSSSRLPFVGERIRSTFPSLRIPSPITSSHYVSGADSGLISSTYLSACRSEMTSISSWCPSGFIENILQHAVKPITS